MNFHSKRSFTDPSNPETKLICLSTDSDLKLVPLLFSALEVLLKWTSFGQRSLVGYSPWGRKESDMTEQLSARVLARERAHTHTHTHTQ